MKLLLIANDEFAALKTPACSAALLISLGDMPDTVIHQVAETTIGNTRVIGTFGHCFLTIQPAT